MSISDHTLGRYWFRIRVPADLISRCGRQQIWRSLGTASPVVAKRRGRYMAIGSEGLWEAIRRNAMLSKDEIDQLVREYFDLYLEQDQVQRYSDKPDLDWKSDANLRGTLALPGLTLDDLRKPESRRGDGAIDGAGLSIAEIESELEETGKHPADLILDRFNWITHVCMQKALQTNDWREASLFADSYIAHRGLPIEKDSEDYRRLCFGLLRATFDATRVILGRADGDWSRQPSDPLFRNPTFLPASFVKPASGKAVPVAPPLLSELVERYLDEKTTITAKFKDDHRAAVRAYEQLLPDRATWYLADTRTVSRFKETLLKAPANWTKLFPGKTLPEAVILNEKRQRPTLSQRTINEKYLRVLNSVLRWAKQNGYADRNAAEGVRVESTKRGRRHKTRHPFSPEQLGVVFRTPLFLEFGRATAAGTARGRQEARHRFWAPLIALHTGARANEIGQLRKRDIVRIDGIACLKLNDHQLKSDAAARTIPIHPNLLKLGLLDLASPESAGNDARLFPEWSKGHDGYYSSTLSKWFARYLSSVGLKDPELVFHSFRHTFKDALRDAGVPEDIQNRLMGHSSNHVGESYGHGYKPAALFDAIERLRFTGLPMDDLANGLGARLRS